MESTRRPFDRSLSKEPGLKKPRLIEDPPAPDRITNGRAGLVQRPAVSNPGGGRVQRDRDSEGSDSVRANNGGQQQLHHELVSQYQTALAELTFNSKPIITNLTIIAGESLHAAKAIAATICANILEVPREQKLPSLYLLDSIVKNIGRDYIKYFASRLPEVFCKVYRQVDPSTHQGMRHLFGTWKGVFPPQTLQAIEKELGFTTTANGSPSETSRSDSQAQRPAHSIHVNPKYLEARQRLQTTRARGPGSDTGDGISNSHEDEALERTASISSGRSWADPYPKSIQHHPRGQANVPSLDKSPSVAYSESEYGSNVSGRSGLGTGRVIEKLKEPGYNRYESVSDVTGMSYHKNGLGMKHGVESYTAHGASSGSGLQLKHHIAGTNIDGMSGNWKNSEEEEYMWDEMSSRPTVRNAADASANDHWAAPDHSDKLDFDNHLRRPRHIHDIRSRDDDEASADSISMDLAQVASATQVPSRSQNLVPPPEGRMLSGAGKSLSGYHEVATGLKSSQGTGGRTPHSQLGPAHSGGQSLKFSTNVIPGSKVSTTQQRPTTGAPLHSARPPIHQRPPSPFSSHNPSQPLNNFAERNQTSIGPTDPRRAPGHKPMGFRDQFSEHSISMPLPSQDVTQRLQPQISRSSSALMPTVQQKKHAPAALPRNVEISEFYSSCQEHNLLPPQISGSESRSTTGNSSSDQSNPLTIDSPGKSITSSLFDSVVKSGNPSSSLSGSLANSISRGPGSSLGGVKPPLSDVPPANLSSSPRFDGTNLPPTVGKEKEEQPPLSTVTPSSLAGIFAVQTSNAVNFTSDPVSSLLSSLVAKGLISSSKPVGPLLSAPPMISDLHVDEVPSIPSTSSTPVTMSKPLLHVTDLPSSFEPAVETSDALPLSDAKIKNLIGFEFKPNVVRKLHPDVISDLTSDLPHQCSICGLRLKLQERLDRHMEWHALRVSDPNNPSWITSRRWYVDEVDWVAGLDDFQRECSPPDMSDETLETSDMVPADESQCACILCGELFEDFYSKERDEWMFMGAVYLTIPSLESHGRPGSSDSSIQSPIVHANCVSENSINDLGLVGDVKMEYDV